MRKKLEPTLSSSSSSLSSSSTSPTSHPLFLVFSFEDFFFLATQTYFRILVFQQFIYFTCFSLAQQPSFPKASCHLQQCYSMSLPVHHQCISQDVLLGSGGNNQQEKDSRQPLRYIRILGLCFYFPFRRNVGFLVCICHVFKITFLFCRHGLLPL